MQAFPRRRDRAGPGAAARRRPGGRAWMGRDAGLLRLAGPVRRRQGRP